MALEERGMRIESKMTPRVFREFALFDTFRRQKRHRKPLLFSVILLAFAAVCFTQVGRVDSAGLLGGVLAAVGLGLPVVYIFSYLASVRRTCKRLEELGCPVVYEVRLLPSCVRVNLDGKEKDYPWKKLHFAYRLQRCVCVYINENQAYLLPNTGDAGHETKLWKLICSHLPEEKYKDLRK